MSFRKIILSVIVIFFSFNLLAQQKTPIYNPQADANHQLDSVISLAKQQNKHVFVQIGGNWCPWCLRMHKFYTDDAEIDSIMFSDYVTLLVNYSRDNKNLDIMTQFGFPQRFGFPVIVILDTAGNVIHTQNTAYLEQDSGYSKGKFIDFLTHWNTNALDPKNYQ